jgi:FAD/FMN-containing dehydrogenase
MHAGDGNVHTNPGQFRQLRNAADGQQGGRTHHAHCAFARWRDFGEHGIGITKLEFLTEAELGPFRAYKQKVDRKAASTRAS